MYNRPEISLGNEEHTNTSFDVGSEQASSKDRGDLPHRVLKVIGVPIVYNYPTFQIGGDPFSDLETLCVWKYNKAL